MAKTGWYQSSYRRNLVDMHIEQWDPSFLSEYDAKRYVALLKQANVQSAMFYANSHVGYCYWPTPVGHMHDGLAGRDIVAQTVAELRKEHIDVILYYTLIYDNWAYDNIPDSRILDQSGNPSRHKDGADRTFTSRYGVCCPNAPRYRDYVKANLISLVTGYHPDGIFLDMTFWPDVCHCGHCRERFRKETGKQLPAGMDWSDADWRLFQRHREDWMTDFAWFCTNVIKDANPDVTVQHQYSTAPGWWQYGVTAEMSRASEFASGDLYGGSAEQSAVCKLFYNLTVHQPFEYMTSRCYPNLVDHTTAKTQEMLRLHNGITLAHNGAFFFIDAIDPRGTLNADIYTMLGRIFLETMPLEPFLTGELAQDVGIYFSLRAKYNPDAQYTQQKKDAFHDKPHWDAVMGAAKCLRQNHIPFGICSSINLDQLSRHRLLIVPDLFALTPEEAQAFREYVERGGTLYTSGRTDAALLGDVLGICPVGQTRETYTYIRPAESAFALLPGVSAHYPLAVPSRQQIVEATDGEVLACITLPYTDPGDLERFASIHSNPPGIDTAHPALVRHRYGKGTAVWCSAALEAIDKPIHQDCLHAILRSVLSTPVSAALQGPAVVELLRFDDRQTNSSTIRLVNLQEQTPVLPVYGLAVEVYIGDEKLASVSALPRGEPVPFAVEGGYARFAVDRLDVLAIYKLQYE